MPDSPTTATPLGRFCWYELLTSDVDGASKFYSQVTGWESSACEDIPYTNFLNGGKAVAGMMVIPPELVEHGVPNHWLAYVSTPDVDATAARAEELGGKVVNRLEIPRVGRMAVIEDPGGPVFMAIQPDDETPGHDGHRQQGEVSWHELISTDMEASCSFYTELFGWEKTNRMDMGPAGAYQMFGRGGVKLGGMMNRNDQMPVPPCWALYIRVADVEAAAGKIAEAGGRITVDPMSVPGGDMILHAMDPQGAAFALHASSHDNT